MPSTLPPDSEGEGDSDLDFEHPQHSPSPTAVTPIAAEPNLSGVRVMSPPNHPMRSASLATVRVTRRARLASKLREIFEIKEISQVLAGEVLRHSFMRKVYTRTRDPVLAVAFRL
jgi:hypothetical protein